MKNLKIGVFDSGVGGLTVLKGLKEALPQETFIYIGDNQHSPYGEKTYEQLLEYTTHIVEYFISQHVKLIVLACNTTSCTVLDELRQRYPRVEMLGVTEATCQMINQHDFKKALIMATKATILSNAYQQRIGFHRSLGLACPELVPLIEKGASHEELKACLHQLLDEPTKVCDCIVLGCTHYPIVAPLIAELYPNQILYSSSEAIVNLVKNYLHTHDLNATKKGTSVIYTTGDLEMFIQSSSAFFDFSHDEVKCLDLEVE